MKKVFFMLLLIVSGVVCVNAQVTIGSKLEPTKAALLDLKTKQADVNNVTSESGGFVLPRVMLVSPTTMEPFVALADPDWANPTNRAALQRSLIGLLVYNLATTNGLEEGVLVWTGASWDKVTTGHPWIIPAPATDPLKHATHTDNAIAAVAQVTIGASEVSMAGSIMQMKEIVNIPDDAANSSKGIGFPRVALSNKDELYPMFAQSDPLYLSKKDSLKKSHTGLVVYNVDETGEGLAKGLSQWDGNEWVSFQTKMGNAKFANVSCADITVNGTYIENADVGANNYLTVAVTVEKIGSYTIAVKSRKHGASTSNGYNFYLTGVAMETGPMTLTLPCQGRPILTTADLTNGKDDLFIEGLSMAPATNNLCENKVPVMTSVATYALNCASVVVNGQYRKGAALNTAGPNGTQGNTITLNVTVTMPGSYSFTTPLTNGISFSASSTFLSAGTQTVTLFGTGTPTQHTDHPITINANTPEGNNQCTAIIPITLPAMTYGVIGSGIWSWESPIRRSVLSNASSASFNATETAKVRVVSLTQAWNASNATAAMSNLTNPGAKPDIILYFAYGADPNTALSTALANYVNNGGVLIYGSADGTASQVRILLDGIFGSANWGNSAGASNSDNVYQINNMPEDPIINGPFGNLANRFWGEDNAGSVYITSLPPNSVQVCSFNNRADHDGVSLEYSMVWYNNSKNFVYFGDCVGATDSDTGNFDYPAIYSTGTRLPLSKRYGYWTSTRGTESVFNAALELNAVAWAIKRAAVSGINPH